MADKRYQLNMFVGSHSFVLRTDSLKEMTNFTGLKKFTSNEMKKFLYMLNDMPLEMGPTVSALATKPAAKALKCLKTPTQDNAGTIALFPDTPSKPDFEASIRKRLYDLGGTTAKKALMIFNKLTGLNMKSLPKSDAFSDMQMQHFLGMVLKGAHNGKK